MREHQDWLQPLLDLPDIHEERGEGEQGLHKAQAGDCYQEWGEATESREDSAEQEDGALLRAGLERHHRSH